MIPNRITRWLPVTILVGCGGGTELEAPPTAQPSDIITGDAGNGSGNTGSGSGNMGNGPSGAPGNGSNGGNGMVSVGGSFPVGGSSGGFPATGGFPNQGGFAQGGTTQAGAAQGGTAQGGATFTRPDQCLLPFDPGPCRGAVAVFGYINGSCTAATYGGCEGNENRFATLEQCMAICDGRPFPLGCPEGRIQIETCVECAPAGGCTSFMQICAASCKDSTECGPGSPGCDNGICQGLSCF